LESRVPACIQVILAATTDQEKLESLKGKKGEIKKI